MVSRWESYKIELLCSKNLSYSQVKYKYLWKFFPCHIEYIYIYKYIYIYIYICIYIWIHNNIYYYDQLYIYLHIYTDIYIYIYIYSILLLCTELVLKLWGHISKWIEITIMDALSSLQEFGFEKTIFYFNSNKQGCHLLKLWDLYMSFR